MQLTPLLAVIATITVNALANLLPINGLQTGQISDQFPVLFVPAGYVFSIWGVIYAGLIAYGVYRALPGQRDNPRLRRTDGWFVLSCVANSAWIFLWHYLQFPLTVPVIVLVLVSLIMVYVGLEIGRTRVSRGEFWVVRVPFSIYLGWASVATIANISQTLYVVGWDRAGVSAEAWATIMLAIAVVLAALMAFLRFDGAYLGVFIWAFVGIGVRQANVPAVALSAWVAAGLVLVFLVVSQLRLRLRPPAAPAPAG
jgi:hypothetical protein